MQNNMKISKEYSLFKAVREIRNRLPTVIPNNLQIIELVNVNYEKGKEE